LVECARLIQDQEDFDDDLDDDLVTLQVWHFGHIGVESTFSLDVETSKSSFIFLAPDGLTVTVVDRDTISSYSRNHDIAQLLPFFLTDEAYLYGDRYSYSPDGKLFACHSTKDNVVRLWDKKTDQLCGKPITFPEVSNIALSPVLNIRSVSDRLIVLTCASTYIINLFDIYTGHLSILESRKHFFILKVE